MEARKRKVIQLTSLAGFCAVGVACLVNRETPGTTTVSPDGNRVSVQLKFPALLPEPDYVSDIAYNLASYCNGPDEILDYRQKLLRHQYSPLTQISASGKTYGAELQNEILKQRKELRDVQRYVQQDKVSALQYYSTPQDDAGNYLDRQQLLEIVLEKLDPKAAARIQKLWPSEEDEPVKYAIVASELGPRAEKNYVKKVNGMKSRYFHALADGVAAHKSQVLKNLRAWDHAYVALGDAAKKIAQGERAAQPKLQPRP